MRTVVFSTKDYDRRTFVDRNDFHGYGHELVFQEARLPSRLHRWSMASRQFAAS